VRASLGFEKSLGQEGRGKDHEDSPSDVRHRDSATVNDRAEFASIGRCPVLTPPKEYPQKAQSSGLKLPGVPSGLEPKQAAGRERA
jgi:hypothetical protein